MKEAKSYDKITLAKSLASYESMVHILRSHSTHCKTHLINGKLVNEKKTNAAGEVGEKLKNENTALLQRVNELENENRDISSAADRNAAKLTQLAILNRRYLARIAELEALCAVSENKGK